VTSATQAVLLEWSRAGLPFVLLRADPADPGGWEKDLDVLVDPQAWPRMQALATEAGFRAERGAEIPYKRVLWRLDENGPRSLDVHLQMVSRGLVYLDRRRMLERRRETAGLFVLSPEDLLLHLVFHCLIGKRRLDSRYVQRIERLLEGAIDERYLVEHARAFGLDGVLEDARRSWTQLKQDERGVELLGERARRICTRRSFRSRFDSLRWSWRDRLPWLRRKGVLVAVVGPDGMGKSTLLQGLVAALQRVAIFPVRTAYLGPFGQNQTFLPGLVHRLGLAVGADERIESYPWPVRVRRGLTASLFFAALWLEMLWRASREVWLRRSVGQVILSDRFPLDAEVLHGEGLARSYGLQRRWLRTAVPRPDLLLLLDCPAAVVAARKPQLDAHVIEEAARRYREVARRYRHAIIDTSSSVERSVAAAANAVLGAYLDRNCVE